MQDKVSYFAIPGIKNTSEIPIILRSHSINDIINSTARYFNITPESLKVKDRRCGITYPRKLAVYLICKNTHYSLNTICCNFGNAIEHHTSAMHYVRNVEGLLDIKDEKAIRDLKGITYLINNN